MRSAIKLQNAHKKRWASNAGFTLVEMSIVLIIIGMVIAASAQIMQQRQEWLQKENTRLAVVLANETITAFRNTHGRYPCPASLTATPNDPLYGIESNSATTKCADTTIVSGAGIDPATGYAVVSSDPGRLVTYTDTITGAITNGPPRIRIGALPFKNLNLEEKRAYDGYGNRIIYAVTEQQAVSSTFEIGDGGIGVLNDQGTTIIQPPDSAHFIILSSGENGAGGFTRGGGDFRFPCAALGTNAESENCNFETDATFKIAQTANTANTSATAFDDLISYATHADIPLWDKNPLNKNPGEDGYNDITVKTSGKFGIGISASENPTEDLQVDGIIIARDDPDSIPKEGNIQSENICDYASGSTTCFPSSLIAGEEATGGGMRCPTNTFMTGIKNGAPICETEVRIDCPSGLIAIGVKADGRLDCGAPPPEDCTTQTVTLCGTSKTLFADLHGSIQTITATTSSGGTRTQKYRCDDGSWKNAGTSGDPCNCTPATKAQETISCDTSSNCGAQYTGTKTVEAQFTCPAGTWVNNTIANSCTCTPSTKTKTGSCPSGFNKGSTKLENKNDCSASPPKCTGWKETSNTCECAPGKQTRQINCSGGLTGKIDQEKLFTCPNGSSNPGTGGSWKNVGGKPDSDFCTCTPSTKIVDRACPISGQIGEYKVKVEFQCPSATTVETEDTNTCKPPPPVICSWSMIGSGGATSTAPLSRKDGNSCSCGTANNSCSKSLGGGTYTYSTCECK